MWIWNNENEVPIELLNLLDVPNLPDELRQEITQSRNEVESYGAVSYPTKARVEFYIHKFADFLENLGRENKTNS